MKIKATNCTIMETALVGVIGQRDDADHGNPELFFYRWDISVIVCWEILVTETFQSFVSQLFENSP